MDIVCGVVDVSNGMEQKEVKLSVIPTSIITIKINI